MVEELCSVGRSLFERGLTPGRTGNLSVRTSTGWIATPTGASLGDLDEERLSILDDEWRLVGGEAPTKEAGLHAVMYDLFPEAGAVVHLHSPHAVALACLDRSPEQPVLRPLTPYLVLRVGEVAWIPYRAPGDPALADELRRHANGRRAVLLANHGPLVAAPDLATAADAIEELEAAARLELLLGGRPVRLLEPEEIAALHRMKEPAPTN